MGIFKSKAAKNVDKVGTKLAEARAAVAPLEAELRERSLDAALSGDNSTVTQVQIRLRAAREAVEMLEMAAGEAQRREDKRLADARTADELARQKSIRQQLAAMEKAARGWQAAVEVQHRAWLDLKSAGENVFDGFNQIERVTLAHYFQPHRLVMYCENELRLLARERAIAAGEIGTAAAPGVPAGQAGQGARLYNEEHLADRIKRTALFIADVHAGRVARPKTTEEQFAGSFQVPPVPATEPTVEVVKPGEPATAPSSQPKFHDIRLDLDLSPTGRETLTEKLRDLVADEPTPDNGDAP